MRHAVIMAGGVGTRLWPMSRQASPKQFQKLIGDQSLFQQTYQRLRQLLPPEQIWVMIGEKYSDIVADQLPELKSANFITEPSARNTAAASGLAVLTIIKHDPAAQIALISSDHYIGKETVFVEALETAYQFTDQQPAYVTAVGIHPTNPNTGYGYIKLGEEITKINQRGIFKVETFREKPDLATAQMYVKSGEYLWNASYFVFNAARMVKHFHALAPELAKKLVRYQAEHSAEEYGTIANDKNFDKIIIEKIDLLAVIPAEMEWSDIGDWTALHVVLTKQGLASQLTEGAHISNNNVNTLVMGNGKLIATVGLKDIVVIDTDDVILVCHKDSSQDIKKVVEKLQEQGKTEYL